MPSGTARAREDCDGENLAALVSVDGRDDGKQNWLLDFDPIRAMAPDLLTVLTLALPILQEVVRAQLLSDDTPARLALDGSWDLSRDARVAYNNCIIAFN